MDLIKISIGHHAQNTSTVDEIDYGDNQWNIDGTRNIIHRVRKDAPQLVTKT
ncbi:MAG: hypothetical protein CM1200mP15_19940 [Dehalococcoidia bacterium]|nr:MAG: hypothetical protein CM1200mP15_19940 [Dehalococcoidia bacterium]